MRTVCNIAIFLINKYACVYFVCIHYIVLNKMVIRPVLAVLSVIWPAVKKVW